jgi:hypothetical protein
MDMSAAISYLTPSEEAFLQALLWEEGRMLKGPATRAAEEHGISLIRCLELANRLSPNLQGEALNRIRDGACPMAAWPWDALNGDEVLRLLWSRLAECRVGSRPSPETSEGPEKSGIEAKRLC